uniref:Uncharacterized protein n=1 Tax=Anguilla anguilla TaxID=7936 RepID=A0A0E9X964_ANGAN
MKTSLSQGIGFSFLSSRIISQ